MPCTMCPHSGCQHSFLHQGITACPECDPGTLVLDPLSAPKWRLDCNRCSFLIYLPANLYSAKVNQDALCEECGSKLMELEWKKGCSPLPGGKTGLLACVVCDEVAWPLCTVKHGRAFVARRGGRGRGRGRRGRGRGRGRARKSEDPLMSFREF